MKKKKVKVRGDAREAWGGQVGGGGGCFPPPVACCRRRARVSLLKPLWLRFRAAAASQRPPAPGGSLLE